MQPIVKLMRLICETLRSNSEDDLCRYCCIDPTPQLLDLIDKRREIVKQAHAADLAVRCIRFGSASSEAYVVWFDSFDEEKLNADLTDDDEWLDVPEPGWNWETTSLSDVVFMREDDDLHENRETGMAINVDEEISFEGFLKFGFADQQTVGRDVRDQQMQCLRDSQSGCGQQANQCRIRLWPQRIGLWKLRSGENKAMDLVTRINVWDATRLPVAEVILW